MKLSLNPASINLADSSIAATCLDALRSLSDSLSISPVQYAIKTDGLMGLNYLLLFSPEEIIFFDHLGDALEYMKLIVECIFFCSTPEEFISRIFSRDIQDFIKKGETLQPFSRLILQKEMFQGPNRTLSQSLNEYTQWTYLCYPYNPSLLEETLGRLSEKGKQRFECFLLPFLNGHVQFAHWRCKRLLPCWPVNEVIPYSRSGYMGKNKYREYEPNTNTFHFGNLWLANAETYGAVKNKLGKAKIRYVPFDLAHDPIAGFFHNDLPGAIYAGEQSEKDPDAWSGQRSLLCVITGSGVDFCNT